MERASEQRERHIRAAAHVIFSDNSSARPGAQSLQECCAQRLGERAAEYFELENVRAALVSVVSTTVEHGVKIVTVKTVKTGNERKLTLAQGPGNLFVCPCPMMVSRGVPCKHLIRHLQAITETTFETYAPYFHLRWLLNLTLPTKAIVDIALKSEALRKTLNTESARQDDLADEAEAAHVEAGNAVQPGNAGGASADDDYRDDDHDFDGGEFNVHEPAAVIDKAPPPGQRRQQLLALATQVADMLVDRFCCTL